MRPARVNGLLGTDCSAGRHGRPAPARWAWRRPRPEAPTTRWPWWSRRSAPTSVRRRSGRPTWPKRWPAPTATPACPGATRRGPSPGVSPTDQRGRRRLKDVLCGLGASEAWTTAFVTEGDQLAAGFTPPYVEVANPLVEAERFLRSSMAPGLLRAVLHNAERRQGDVRLFEVGSVFHRPEIPAGDGASGGGDRAAVRGLRRRRRRRLGGGGRVAHRGRRARTGRLGPGAGAPPRGSDAGAPRIPFGHHPGRTGRRRQSAHGPRCGR